MVYIRIILLESLLAALAFGLAVWCRHALAAQDPLNPFAFMPSGYVYWLAMIALVLLLPLALVTRWEEGPGWLQRTPRSDSVWAVIIAHIV